MNVPYIYEIDGEYFTALHRAVTYLLVKYEPNQCIKDTTLNFGDGSIVYTFILSFEDIGWESKYKVTRHKLNKDYK